jgi:hypothetical protein
VHTRVVVELVQASDEVCLGDRLVELNEFTLDTSLHNIVVSGALAKFNIQVTHLLGGLQLHANISG